MTTLPASTTIQPPRSGASAPILALSLAGCMLSPTDDGRVTSTTAPLPFEGYVTQPNAPVQVRAWSYTANAMGNVGAPVMSTTTPTGVDGGPLYGWFASRTLPAQFWRTGPAGGQCAAVGARTTLSSGVHDVITVESDWASCYNEHPSAGEFYTSCASDSSPVAKIYTNSWGSLTIDQARLNLAGIVASGQISLTLDNYTPTAYQFCNAGNPSGCPDGGADPETYKYYAPNASSLVQDGQPPFTFSIAPSRRDPMTIYIDNLSKAGGSSGMTFTTSGSRFVLGINFESSGPEIRMNCIRNGWCAVLGNPDLELATPRASISFALDVVDGRVTYTDAVATFTTTSTGDAASAAAGIGEAMTEMLNTNASVKGAVAGAIDAVIRQAAGLGTFPLDDLSIGSGVIQVRPGCPLD
jgi:hypothetical protein